MRQPWALWGYWKGEETELRKGRKGWKRRGNRRTGRHWWRARMGREGLEREETEERGRWVRK